VYRLISQFFDVTRLVQIASTSIWAIWASIGIDIHVAVANDEADLLLVLAADVSYSVNETEFLLQRQGHAKAIASPPVLSAIQAGWMGRIAVCFIEWSGPTWQTVVVDWTLLNNVNAARRFSDKIIQAPRSFSERTSISGAIDFAAARIQHAPFWSERKVIDISGDGDNNAGRGVTSARDDAIAKGITINGLVISNSELGDHLHPSGGIKSYYEQNVIGGPGAFVMAAENFESFGSVLIKKLVTEIASGP
jgi:Protein of unknown function (DUF1194)